MTLIEILVVVVLSSLVMGVIVTFAVALQRSDRNVRSLAVRGEQRSELAESLRSDIRRSAQVSLTSAKKLAMKLADGGEIQYELVDRGCRRIVNAGGDSPERGLFAVGDAESWELEQEEAGRRPLLIVTLHSTKADKKSKMDSPSLLVYAALGADLPSVLVGVSQAIENQTKLDEEDVEQAVAEEAKGSELD